MTEKKYQVFVSSTYEDLKEERRAVEETIIRAGDFPVGMEAFPAADEEQFEFIETIIDQCDFYVLIIAGRYGSITSDGKSYTEKEYHYAVKVGVPVLVMLRDKQDQLPEDKTETDSEKRTALKNFITHASDGRLHKLWATPEDLKLAVYQALDHAKATKNRPGWVKGDKTPSAEVLEKLVALQQDNEQLRESLSNLNPKFKVPENLAGLDTAFSVTVTYRKMSILESCNIESSFGEIFELLAPHLMLSMTDFRVKTLIGSILLKQKLNNMSGVIEVQVTDEQFQTIKIQLIALKVVKVEKAATTNGSVALFWNLTEYGTQEMISRRVIVEQ